MSFLWCTKGKEKKRDELTVRSCSRLGLHQTLSTLTIIRRKAACASGVTVSASSKIITLNGGLGKASFSSSTSMASSFFFLKKEAADFWACDLPTARLAKCLILSRTTEMPRSSLALSSRTRLFHSEGCQSCRQRAKATDVCGKHGIHKVWT